MVDIVALFPCLQPAVTATTRRHFSRIAMAMLVMTPFPHPYMRN
jgi:hypothetical protein